jgi:hypothetical protein
MVQKSEGKRQLGTRRGRYKDNIKVDLKQDKSNGLYSFVQGKDKPLAALIHRCFLLSLHD